MYSLMRFFRVLHINWILLKHGLDEIVLETHFFRPIRFLSFFSPHRLTQRRKVPRAVRIREALEELGPIFVKLGQQLSTRPDILPEDIVKELAKLQDRVPPFPGQLALLIVEKSLGKPVTAVFQQFETKALASASIAQVHAATLQDGRSVVVKVLRPTVEKEIKRDLSLIMTFARLLHRYSKIARQFKPKEIVLEFEKVLNHELDFMREAANASQLRRNFLNDDKLYVPEIIWEFTKKDVLVMERIYGIPIYNVSGLKEKGYNLKLLAELSVEIFFIQVFRDSFFHADMHPGNILVSTDNIAKPTLLAVDFGVMGSLDRRDQRYLAENFLAFFKRDYRRVAELHIESGWLPKNTRVDDFESAIRSVCEPMFERPIREISAGQLLLRLLQTATHFQINIQPQLILLQKTLLTIEGVGRELYPELDLWKTAKPFLEKWMKDQMGPQGVLKKLRQYAPYWLEKLPEIPELMYRALSKAATVEALPERETVVIAAPSKSLSWGSLMVGILLGAGFCLGVLFLKV